MNALGNLNYIKVTIEKNKEIRYKEDGKIIGRYIKLLEMIDPENKYGLKCENNLILLKDNPIMKMKTYSSESESVGFSLTDEEMETYNTLCVALDNEKITWYYIKKGTHIDRFVSNGKSGSEQDLSGAKLEKYECTLDDIRKIITNLN